MNTPKPNFFTREHSEAYDQRNSKLSAIADNMHFLIRLVLNELPTNARILCVGVGTGAEILSLATAFPGWTFVGLDPSQAMLDVCATNLEKVGIANRCELIQGYVQDAPTGEIFDAALSILVAHFIPRPERLAFFANMASRLKPGGYLVNTEISGDLDSPQFPLMFKDWAKVQALMGATPESLANLPKMMREVLTILPQPETEQILRQTGLEPIRFFQSFMITGWHAQKA